MWNWSLTLLSKAPGLPAARYPSSLRRCETIFNQFDAIIVILHQSMKVIWGSTLFDIILSSLVGQLKPLHNWTNLIAIYVGFSRIAGRTENWAICGWFMSKLKPECTLPHTRDLNTNCGSQISFSASSWRSVVENRWWEFYYINIVREREGEWQTVG